MKSKLVTAAVMFLAVLFIAGTKVSAAAAPGTTPVPRGNFYYTTDCKDCKTTLLDLNHAGLQQAARVTLRDVKVYSSQFTQDLQKCQLDPQKVSPPVLALNGVCYVGLDAIKTELQGKISNYQAQVLSAQNGTLPIVSSGVTTATAKKNTLIFIGGMTLGLILLVGVGYLLERGRKKDRREMEKDVQGLAVILTAILAVSVSVILIGRTFLVEAQAFCPVCTVAVGAGLVFAKEMGIDDVISSIWIGGLLLSMSFWLINWLRSRKIHFRFMRTAVFLVMYGFVIIPFMISKTIGPAYNRLWGVDKIVLGIILGTGAFGGGMLLSNYVLKKNNGKVYFPFQKVVIPIIMLIIFSLIFYFIVY
jgi:hypothetical protein